MYKSFLLLLTFLLSIGVAMGQHRQSEDVVHLSNHWIVRGKIILKTDSSIDIRTRDGNVFVFPIAQVEKITTEPAWSLQNQSNSRWTNYTELGPLIAGKTTINGVTTAAFSFQTLLGYKITSSFVAGIGAGADLYATQTILPTFVTLRKDLIQKPGYSLFCFGDGGYGWNITQETETGTAYKGGPLYAAGLGFRIPFSVNAGFLLSFGYRYQKTTVTENDLPSPVIYRRLALRAGFYL